MSGCLYSLLVVLLAGLAVVWVADGAPAPDDDDAKIYPDADSFTAIIKPVTDKYETEKPTPTPTTTRYPPPTYYTTPTTNCICTTTDSPPVTPTPNADPSCQSLGAGQYKSNQPSMYFRCIFDARIVRWLKYYFPCAPGFEFVNSLQKCVKP